MSHSILPLGGDSRAALRQLAETLNLPRLQPGWVWLAGAGPGDPGLASLHTLTAIAVADVIFLDALVNRALLKLARPDADIVDSGKRGGKPSPSQDTISRRLVLAASRGRKVLRLKGGDPFVFGRGGEEALALVRAGIPFRIVPGVTAGIGGLAYAGIPVTHRDVNQAVTFVTGSGVNGRAPELDWQAIAKGSPTIVLFMARKHAGEIAGKLITAGRDPNEPAAIVSSASLDEQTTTVTTLAGLGAAADAAEPPAILLIGENVRLAEGLDWLAAAKQGRALNPDPLQRGRLSKAG